MEIVDVLMAGGSGGLTGLAGSLIGRGFAFFERKQSHAMNKDQWAEDQRKRDHETVMDRQRHEQVKELHAMNLEGKELEFDRDVTMGEISRSATGMEASYKDQQILNAQKGGSPRVADFIKLQRPILTHITLIALIAAYFITPDLQQFIILALVYLAIMSFAWWFGDRMGDKMQSAIFGRLS